MRIDTAKPSLLRLGETGKLERCAARVALETKIGHNQGLKQRSHMAAIKKMSLPHSLMNRARVSQKTSTLLGIEWEAFSLDFRF